MAMIDIGSVVSAAGSTLDKLFTSDAERNEAKITMERLKQQPQILQLLTNIEEAKSSKLFVAGWRPFLGWGLSGMFLLGSLMNVFIAPILSIFHVNMVEVHLGELIPLLVGLLGLGAYRSIDKIKGTTVTYKDENGITLPPPASTK